MAGLQSLIETKRLPLIQARINLGNAEADMNGLVASLAAGSIHLGKGKSYDIVRAARDRLYAARDAMDQARFDALGIHKINDTVLTTNDADSMGDCLLTAVDRNEGNAREDAGDLNAANVLGASDYGVGRAA